MDLRPSKKKMTIFLVLLIIVEFILFWFGARAVQCSPCASSPPAYCPPCISYDAGLYIVLLTIVPVAIIIYVILSLLPKKPKKQ